MAYRAAILTEICLEAGRLAVQYFKDQDKLIVDRKGHQDFVSQADRNVERRHAKA